MIIRSLEQPVYNRQKKGGLPGAGLKAKGIPERENMGKSFEEYLTEAFKGEVVQQGAWFSDSLSDLSRKNLDRI
ncbi:MAG: hypothetical protein K8R21_03865 [Leptospira sp.]|nr:hypothetical protein [Leptospira sp.]